MRLLHLQIDVAHELRVVVRCLDLLDPGRGIRFAGVELLDLLVGNQRLLWLLALLVQDTQVVPQFVLESVKRCRLDDILERISVVSVLVVHDGQSCPVSSFAWVLESRFLEQFECLLEVILGHVTPALDVERVRLALLEGLDGLAVLERLVNVVHQEGAPSQVLIDLEVGLVADGGSFVLFHRLAVILLLFVQQTNFEERIGLPFQGEGVGQNGVLEVADCLLNLVSLCKDHAQLVQDFALLVEVGRHLEDCNESADGVVV